MNVYESLCSYDSRSPEYKDLKECDGDDMPEARRAACFCDNCFYGRDALVVQNIELVKTLKTVLKFSDWRESSNKIMKKEYDKARELLKEIGI